MIDETLLHHITHAARSRYGDLQAPDFHFVAQALADPRLHAVIRQVAEAAGSVREDTDPNDDTALGAAFDGAPYAYFLQLSVIYPVASFRRVLPDHRIEQIANGSQSATALERQVLKILWDNGIVPLDRDALMTPFPINLPNTPAGEAVLYNALFSDADPGLSR